MRVSATVSGVAALVAVTVTRPLICGVGAGVNETVAGKLELLPPQPAVIRSNTSAKLAGIPRLLPFAKKNTKIAVIPPLTSHLDVPPCGKVKGDGLITLDMDLFATVNVTPPAADTLPGMEHVVFCSGAATLQVNVTFPVKSPIGAIITLA